MHTRTIEQLEEVLKQYSDAYYNDEPLVSDAEFDALLAELKQLSPQSKFLSQVGSPVKSDRKIKHRKLMGSLPKVHDVQWLAGRRLVVVMPKLDGISAEVIYDKGIAVQASTRGDGEFGEDIFAHVQAMSCRKLPVEFTGVLYGEFFMRHSTFEEKYQQEYANSRNLVAGIAHRLDASGAEDCEIRFFDGDLSYFTAEVMSAEVAEFFVPRYFLDLAKTDEYVPEIYKSWLDFPTDGLVWWDLRTNEKTAFKFPAEKKQVSVEKINWQLSKSGNLIPVLNFTPVKLAGATVSNCTCNNASWIKDRGIGIGSVVVVQRANEVIPNLVEVRTTSTVELPTICPECTTALENKGVHLHCPNQQCPNLVLQDLIHFFVTIGVKGFSDSWFKKLFDLGYDKVQKILALEYSQIADKSTITEHNFDKFQAQLMPLLRKCSVPSYCKALNIPNAGRTTFEKICSHYNITNKNYSDLLKISKEQLSLVPGVNYLAVDNITTHLPLKFQMIPGLGEDLQVVDTTEILVGTSFCFTGKLYKSTRSQAEALVKSNGGTVKSVSAGLTYLVTNDTQSNSSKALKAKALGVKTINEDQFYSLLSANPREAK